VEDPYIILQIPRSASPARIKQAYRIQLNRHRAAEASRDFRRRETANKEIERIEQAYAQLQHSQTEPLPAEPKTGRPRFSLAHLALLLIVGILGAAAFLVFSIQPDSAAPLSSERAATATMNPAQNANAARASSTTEETTGFELERIVPNEIANAIPESKSLPQSAIDQVSFDFYSTGERVEGELANDSDWTITEVEVEFSREYWDGENLLDSDRPAVTLQMKEATVPPNERVAFSYELTEHLAPRSFDDIPVIPIMTPVEVSIQGIRESSR